MAKIVLLLVLIAPVAGCNLLDLVPRGCTAAGCESAVVFDLEADLQAEVSYQITACFDGRCEEGVLTVPPPADGPFTGTSLGALSIDTDSDSVTLALGEGDFAGDHAVQLTVRTASGDVIARSDEVVEFQPNQPNGPGCEPICWLARVDV